jgi:hypothetical protein
MGGAQGCHLCNRGSGQSRYEPLVETTTRLITSPTLRRRQLGLQKRVEYALNGFMYSLGIPDYYSKHDGP